MVVKFSSKGSRTFSIFLLDRKYYIFLQLSKANFQSKNSLFEQIVSTGDPRISWFHNSWSPLFRDSVWGQISWFWRKKSKIFFFFGFFFFSKFFFDFFFRNHEMRPKMESRNSGDHELWNHEMQGFPVVLSSANRWSIISQLS